MTQKTWMRIEALLPHAEAEQVMALIRSFGVQGGPWSTDEGRGGRDQRSTDPAQMEWEPLGEPCPECWHFTPDHSIGCTRAPVGLTPAPNPLDSPEMQAALDLIDQINSDTAPRLRSLAAMSVLISHFDVSGSLTGLAAPRPGLDGG